MCFGLCCDENGLKLCWVNTCAPQQVRTGRSIRGYPLPPHSNRAERREIEAILAKAGQKLSMVTAGKLTTSLISLYLQVCVFIYFEILF